MGRPPLPMRFATTAILAALVGMPPGAAARSPTGGAGQAQSTTRPAADHRTRPLLDGSLTKWLVPDQIARRVAIADGVLSLPASTHWLQPPGVHDDLSLSLRFRPEAGASVGVLIRGIFSHARTRLQYGYEAWLVPPEQGEGTLVSVRATERETHPLRRRAATTWADTWHTLLVEAHGEVVQVSLDGELAFSSTGASPHAGELGFRATGGSVEWRDVYLRAKLDLGAASGAVRPESRAEVPKLRREVKPNYTRGAMSRRVEGEVWLECIVLEDGSVGEAMVIKPLDPELDEQALLAAKRWQFEPGRRDGKPVKVIVTISMAFALRK